MQPAALLDREPERLSALRRLEVMDTPADESLERLTDLACDIFSAPIALVSLVDEHRQWFKSHVGLEVNQTPRAYSFCAHALDLDSALVVENALEDVRFADNPLVLGEPHIRFYAGHPLRPLDGHAVGTLCVIDTAPRTSDA
ncbi:GAF domain-containing protein, partial [Halomonas sp. 707D4]|uniref:GAF domain-containing protein n=1 Tax=Halomonas sp. 707D4 TaxID=1904455 RepID=UPI00209DB34A